MIGYEIMFYFFLIAIVYSSVGFGGGSSYLALMALFGIDFQLLKITALLCNIMVVLGGTYWFWKRGFLNWKKVLPLTLFSVPLAYLGGSIQLTERIFFLIAGIALVIAGILVLVQKSLLEKNESSRSKSAAINSGFGGGIGFLSGLIGIGGGIFLSPFLHLIRWDKAKVIAATSSFFILVNSIAGLAGQFSNGTAVTDWKPIIALLFVVLIGGQIGSRWGSGKLSAEKVRIVTAILVLVVGVRIIFKYL